MMIPYGYKQTEVGVIPEDWECTTAKQLMKIETGSRNTENKTNTGIYPFFVRSQKIESIDTYHYNCEAVLTAGDGVGTGKVFHYYIGKFDAHQRVYVMSGFNGISGRYFYYYFSENFEKEVSKYTAKSSVDSVRHDMIAEMKIPLPPLPEQQRIAEALSDVDGMISSLEKLIAKYKSIKTACLQQMFPQNGETVPRMRLPGFTGAWEQRKLGDIGKARSGVGFPDADQGGVTGVPFFKVSDMNLDGNENEMTVANNYVTAEQIADHRWSPITELPAIFFAKVGAAVMLNRKRLCRFPFLLDNNTMAYSLSPTKWDADFAKALFGTIDLTSLVQVGALPSYNAGDVESMEIYLPSLLEQEQIGAFFKQLDNLITLHQRKLVKVQKIKQGMMQQLLTGKIRLV